MVAPILDELASEYEGRVAVVKVNVDYKPRARRIQYVVQRTPTRIFSGRDRLTASLGLDARLSIREKLNTLLG